MTKTIEKILLMIILIILGSQVKTVAQVTAVFENYDYPSKEEIYNLATENSPKGQAYRTIIIQAARLGLQDTLPHIKLEEIFENLFTGEVKLSVGKYQNSGYNTKTKRMVQSIGTKNLSFCWILQIGSYFLPLIKDDCGNVIIADLMGQPYVPEKRSIMYDENQNNSNRSVVTVDIPTNTVGIPTNSTFYLPQTSTTTKKVVDGVKVAEIGGVTLVVGGLIWWGVSSYLKHKKSGSPGGAPITHDPINPPDPPDPGGPGGAPITH